jgi:hypothetical protein
LLQEGNAEALRAALHHLGDPRRAVAEMVRACRRDGRVVLSDLVAPSAELRDAFDQLHRRIDPSHVRAFLESELGNVFPDGVALSSGDTTSNRLPIDIALTEQSETETVLTALRAEMQGGAPTGFEPTEEDGKLVVAFRNCVVHGTRV